MVYKAAPLTSVMCRDLMHGWQDEHTSLDKCSASNSPSLLAVRAMRLLRSPASWNFSFPKLAVISAKTTTHAEFKLKPIRTGRPLHRYCGLLVHDGSFVTGNLWRFAIKMMGNKLPAQLCQPSLGQLRPFETLMKDTGQHD